MDGLDTLRLMILSPALAAAASLVVFTVVTAARRQHWWAAFQHYVKVLKWPVIIGVGSAFVYVIGWTAINKAGNGPLALIFLGPVGLAAGIVLGTVIWPFVSMKPNNTFERDARQSGARPSP